MIKRRINSSGPVNRLIFIYLKSSRSEAKNQQRWFSYSTLQDINLFYRFYDRHNASKRHTTDSNTISTVALIVTLRRFVCFAIVWNREKDRDFFDGLFRRPSARSHATQEYNLDTQTHPHIRAFISSFFTFSFSSLLLLLLFFLYNDASSIVTVIIVRLICSLPTPSFIRKRGQTGDVISNTQSK